VLAKISECLERVGGSQSERCGAILYLLESPQIFDVVIRHPYDVQVLSALQFKYFIRLKI
jgi:hypothetical protein